MELDIQRFADGKVVIQTELDTKNFKNGLDRMQNTAKGAGASIKGIVAGLGITKLISAAFNTIRNSMDDAITRLDTLNNFPKVMSNLGVSATDSKKAIKDLSDGLKGLPTTLDSGARAVQRFTSKNGDVKKSTNLFLALNNAILAGGAPTEMQATALEQLSQAYAKGKPDMMEWRSAMSAMPAQLKQVAKAMGYVNADELGEALRNGTVSMDDFMDTITKLNKEGVDGFKSFEEQAKNSTNGIQTSITNMKTALVRGITDMIGTLNTKLEAFGGISGIFQNITKGISGMFDDINNIINSKDPIKELQKFTSKYFDIGKKIILNMLKGIRDNLPTLINGFYAVATTLYNKIAEAYPEFLKVGMEILRNILKGIIENLPLIVTTAINFMVTMGTELIKALPYLISMLPELIVKLVDALADPKMLLTIKSVGPKIILALAQALIESIPNLLLAVPKIVLGLFQSLYNKIVNTDWLSLGKAVLLGIINGMLSFIGSIVSTAQNIVNSVANVFKKLPDKVKDVGKNIMKGLWNGIKGLKDWVIEKVKGMGGAIVKGLKKALGIKSPSKVMRDEVGKNIVLGIGAGFDDEIDKLYDKMQHTIDIENSKLQANVETGKVFNSLVATTPVNVNLNAGVELDGQKVGRLITPEVSRTIKSGGGV